MRVLKLLKVLLVQISNFQRRKPAARGFVYQLSQLYSNSSSTTNSQSNIF